MPSITDDRNHSSHRLVFWAILILVVVCVTEAGAFTAVHLLLRSPAQFLFWNPNLDVARRDWTANGAAVDDELGWPSPIAATSGTGDASGAKINADFPEPDKSCMSAYGDSFVWGDEVPPADGWIEQLSRRLGCRVSNYGVSGYGTDQAYIRFRRLEHDSAPVVLLGIFPDDIVRTVNQFRAFIAFGLEPFWIKGRFILDTNGQLQWIARPHLDANSYLDLIRNPKTFLPHEYFLPDTRDGPVSVHFPYTLVAARLALMPRLWNRLRGQTPWSDFYSPSHPSGAVPLTIAIVQAFVQEAERKGKRVFVMMLPGAGSFRVMQRTGKTDYAPFVDAAAAKGLSVFDPAPALITALKGQSYCTIYVSSSCAGHFSIHGGALVAQVVATELNRRNLVN
jgi:hypothetical protein